MPRTKEEWDKKYSKNIDKYRKSEREKTEKRRKDKISSLRRQIAECEQKKQFLMKLLRQALFMDSQCDKIVANRKNTIQKRKNV